jgi:DNA-binding NarL/FixJ family response regulator
LWIRLKRNLLMNQSSSSSEDGSISKTEDGEERRRQVKVLLADDHTLFREGLASMLASSHGDEVEVVGRTDIGQEAVALAQQTSPEVIIMQVDRTLRKAKSTLEQMRRESQSSPRIIILTMFEEPRILRKIMDLGADAYIHKSATVEELLAALRTTTSSAGSAKHTIIAMPQGALELSEDGAASKDGAGRKLSKREFEVLLLAARGMSNRKIASHLNLAEPTVKRHLANIYPKMDVSSRGEAVRIALEREWLTIPELEETARGDGEV